MTNSLTALSLQGAKVPIYFDTDREVIGAALGTLSLQDLAQARVVRITDTLSVERLLVSEACLAEATADPTLEIVGAAVPMEFDAAGNLSPVVTWPRP